MHAIKSSESFSGGIEIGMPVGTGVGIVRYNRSRYGSLRRGEGSVVREHDLDLVFDRLGRIFMSYLSRYEPLGYHERELLTGVSWDRLSALSRECYWREALSRERIRYKRDALTLSERTKWEALRLSLSSRAPLEDPRGKHGVDPLSRVGLSFRLSPEFKRDVDAWLRHRSVVSGGRHVGVYENTSEARVITLFPKQLQFIGSEVDELLYGGARGGAKTFAMAIDAALHPRTFGYDKNERVVLTHSIDYGEYKALLLRRSYTDIETNFKPMCDSIYERLGGVWRAKQSCYIFPSGAAIYLRHCKDDSDVSKYIGGNYHYLGIEEVNQFPERWVDQLAGSVRTTHPSLRPLRRYTTNPGGVGHVWLKKRFIDVCPPVLGRPVYNKKFDIEYTEVGAGAPYTDETGLTRWFIPSLVFDNPAIIDNDPSYVNKLKSIKDPVLRKMWLLGKWDDLSGVFFNEWSPLYHIYSAGEFRLDKSSCRIYRAIDYGTVSPYVCLFAQVDHQGRVDIFDECWGTGMTPTTHALDISSKMRRWGLDEDDIYLTVCDPSIKTGTQAEGKRIRSVMEIYQENGLKHMALGDHARVQGWSVVRDYLRIPDASECEPGEEPRPLLRFSTNCTYCLETIPLLVRSYKNLEDLDTSGEDHAADALRYLLMFIQTPSIRERRARKPEWLRKLEAKARCIDGVDASTVWTA